MPQRILHDLVMSVFLSGLQLSSGLVRRERKRGKSAMTNVMMMAVMLVLIWN